MQEYLLDTWFLVARVHRSDGDHQSAERLWRRYGNARLVTHDGVLCEFLTYFAEFGAIWRQRAVELVRSLAAHGITVVAQDRALFSNALSLYEQRLDKGYSIVDCMSMEFMKARGITHVLTNDHHFRQEKFIVLSDVS